MTGIALVRMANKKYYGGRAYERALLDALSEDFDVELIDVGINSRGLFKYIEAPLVLWRLFRISRRKDLDVVIRDFEGSLFLNRRPTKNIFLLFHIDVSQGSLVYKLVHLLFGKYIFHKLRDVDASVVMGKYWQNFLHVKDFTNVRIAYVPSDPGEFKFTSAEIEEFKKKYGLTAKPVVYLGVAREEKGFRESFEALKHLDYHFVISGDPSLKKLYSSKPIHDLRLDRRDYLRLLKASDVVVAMSKVLEGWCINVQEAMLCKTPVVGSGEGGMAELLEGGEQLICKNFEDLKDKVNFAIEHQELGERGYQFAKTLTVDKFGKSWIDLINEVSKRG